MSIEWIAACFAGGSLVLSLVILILVWRALATVRRTEEEGNERLEILHEQRERLDLMYEERGLLLEALEVQKQMLERERRPLELPAPPNKSQGAPQDASDPEGSAPTEGEEGAWQRWRGLFRQ